MDDGTQENIPLDRLIEHLTGPVHPSAP
jgi:hypothetical protein